MKFCKQFCTYIQMQEDFSSDLSFVKFKQHKKLLKKCRLQYNCSSLLPSSDSFPDAPAVSSPDVPAASAKCSCPSSCPVCDCTFFPLLVKEVAAVSGCFNSRVQKLLQIHLASGLQKFFLRLRHKHASNHLEMIKEGRNLVNYVSMNALAIRKILKKYDKVHMSKRGWAFKSRLQTAHVELLQSPWLVELIAFHINMKDHFITLPEMFSGCSHDLQSSKPTISCTMSESLTLEVDLTCSICLELVFEPVCLKCGHIFCNSCACSAASVLTIEGLKSADRSSKCPLCRQARVYEEAVYLAEVDKLIRTRCKDYWEKRLKMERVNRLEQAKRHWEEECRAVMGY